MTFVLIANGGTLIATLGGIAIYNRVRFRSWRRGAVRRVEIHAQPTPITLDAREVAKSIQRHLPSGR